MPKLIALDFDGVLNSYASGWQADGSIPDAPVPGAMRFLEQLHADARYATAIFSLRNTQPGGVLAMQDWLREHLARYHLQHHYRPRTMWAHAVEIVNAISFPQTKPRAWVFIDDRGWRFEGTFPTLDTLETLERWSK